ncbi:MAG: DUF4956 domain-containing protein [Planctomycetes bacterium]|nr:DUF4956 domain-containing protein [Planctomycetota bacterium]
MFEQFVKEWSAVQEGAIFNPIEIAIVLFLSFILALIIGKVYQVTHKGISYSQSNVQTYVMMCVIVAVIMLIIGSNIARAFSLVGALSIVRFRNAVKESRDVGFVFWAMAIGMAVGTKFYLMAVFATVVITMFVLLMYYLNFFARTVRERILMVEVDDGVKHEELLGELFRKSFREHFLISMETLPEAKTVQLVYSITLPSKFESGPFFQRVRELTGQKKVSLIEGHQQMDL